MRRLLLSFVVLPILCTSCWYLEDVDPYRPEYDPEYKSKLYYTTTDGKAINLSNPDAFGLDIIGMTYEDGQGIITFDGKARRIGYKAFKGCDNLQSVILPEITNVIEEYAFEDCAALEEVVLSDDLKDMGYRAFAECKSLKSITIPENIKYISKGIFSGCESLNEFKGAHTSNDGRCIIWEYEIDTRVIAFAPANIEEYTLPEEAEAVWEMAFENCESLKRVAVPDNYKTIYSDTFCNCASLEEVALGSGIQEIGYRAFSNCAKLRSLYIKATTPPTIYYGALSIYGPDGSYPCDHIRCDIYVPTESVEAYKNDENWKQYAEYIRGYDFEQ